MLSRDEALSASTNEARRVVPHTRPRDAGRGAAPASAERETAPLLETVPDPDLAPTPTRLRAALVAVDVAAVTIGWALAAGWAALYHDVRGVALVQVGFIALFGVLATMFMVASQGLYRSRVCAVRAVEIARLGRATAVSGAAALLIASMTNVAFGVSSALVAVAGTWFLLTAMRGLYGAWLGKLRLQGRYCRSVVVIGTGDEGYELDQLVKAHPELGLRVAGVIGPRHSLARWDGDVAWLGEITDAGSAVQAAGANGVIVAVSDLGADELNRLTRQLLRNGVHVQLSSGLRGIDQRRLRSQPLAHEPLFYLEPVSLSRWQLATKRVMDLVLASIVLVVAAPVLIVAALAVKLNDGGPVLFRQVRVGKGGREFKLFKLRTMVTDAEARLVDLTFANERQDGPLFKLTQDPRRTSVGRILERTSLDELPQLFNVLRGDMSLVGPRPALPHEVAQFDDELRGRQRVLPGITGLWQVEGRENPAFDVYRRLDLFYVENWSVGFDLAILMGTAQSVLLRFAWRAPKSEPVAGPELAGSSALAQGS